MTKKTRNDLLNLSSEISRVCGELTPVATALQANSDTVHIAMKILRAQRELIAASNSAGNIATSEAAN